MNLSFDAKRAFFNHTGLGNHNRALLLGLMKLYPNESYILFSPRPSDHPFAKEIAGNPNTTIQYPKGIFWRTLKSLWRLHALGKAAENQKADVFHGLSHELPLDIKRFTGKKIVTIHDLIFLRYPKNYRWADVRIHIAKTRFACEHADQIISVSEQTRQDIHDFYGIALEKIAVVPPLIAPLYREFSPKSAPNHLKQIYHLPSDFILYVGSLTYRKNVITLLQALLQTDKDIALAIVGTGAEKENLTQFIHQHALTKRVFFLDHVPNAHLAHLYNQAQFVVYPSLFEGFGMPIQEALFCGTPVITGEGLCYKEAGGKGAIYTDITRPEAIAASIQSLWKNPSLRKKLSEEGYNHVSKFSEENIISSLYTIYKS